LLRREAPVKVDRTTINRTNETMGPQSQRRINLTARCKQMQQAHKKKTKAKFKTQQQCQLSQTGFLNNPAFDHLKDCKKCISIAAGRGSDCHKAHHQLCPFKRKPMEKLPLAIPKTDMFTDLTQHAASFQPFPQQKQPRYANK
jgi:hypothetical protein